MAVVVFARSEVSAHQWISGEVAFVTKPEGIAAAAGSKVVIVYPLLIVSAPGFVAVVVQHGSGVPPAHFSLKIGQDFAVEETVFVAEIVVMNVVAEMFEFVKKAASVEFVENLEVDTVVCAGETVDNVVVVVVVVEAVLHTCKTDVVLVQPVFEDNAESIVVEATVGDTFEIGVVFRRAAYMVTVDGVENIAVAVETEVADFVVEIVFVLVASVLTVVDNMEIVEHYVVVEFDTGAFEIGIVFVIAASVVTVVDDAVEIFENYVVVAVGADDFEIVFVKSASGVGVVEAGDVEIIGNFVVVEADADPFEVGIV